MIDVRDNNYTNESPCIKCDHHLAGINKSRCSMICLRLAAYRSGVPWEEKPIPVIKNKRKEVVVVEETNKTEVNDHQVEAPKKVCVICLNPQKPILNKRSKTCRVCYQRWRKGVMRHPTIGKFTRSQTQTPKTKILTSKKENPQKANNISKLKAQIAKLRDAIDIDGQKKIANMGTKIKNTREKLNLSQEELSVYLNISRAQLTNIEAALSSTGIKTLINICDTLETTPNELLGYM